MHTIPPLRPVLALCRLGMSLGVPLRGRLLKVRRRGFAHPLHIRVGTSDISAFSQLMIGGDLAGIELEGDPKWIFDFGANAGYASAWMANRWPEARIFALEADPGNFPVLVKNCAPYGERIVPILGALWKTDGFVRIRRVAPNGISGGEWASQVTEAGAPEGPVVPAFSLAQAFGWIPGGAPADFVKMDIEGAEAEVLQAAADVIRRRVRCLAVELHSEEAAGAFGGIERCGLFEPGRAGEYRVLRRKREFTAG